MPENEQPRGLIDICIDWLKSIFCYVVYDFSNISEADYNRLLRQRRNIGNALFAIAFCLLWVASYEYFDVVHNGIAPTKLILVVCFSFGSAVFCVYLSGANMQAQPLRSSRSRPLPIATTEMRSFQTEPLVEEVAERSSRAVPSPDPLRFSSSEDPSGLVASVSVSQAKETLSDSDVVTIISKQIESPAKQLSADCDVPPDNQTPSTSGLQTAAEESSKILSDE